jgi:hypothetical protein
MAGTELPQSSKPDWWSEAWDLLMGHQMESGKRTEPVSPLKFKDEVHMDVFGFDQPGYQMHMDSESGQLILQGEGNELLGGVTGVIWSDYHVTMPACTCLNDDLRMTYVRNFWHCVALCPEGRSLSFETRADDLVSELTR